MTIFVLYFSTICVRIENDRLVGTIDPVVCRYGMKVIWEMEVSEKYG